MTKVVVIFKNPAGATHREIVQVPQGGKPTEHPKVVMRLKELQKELDCEIIKVFVEKGDEGKSKK